jgi:hypothetical protein
MVPTKNVPGGRLGLQCNARSKRSSNDFGFTDTIMLQECTRTVFDARAPKCTCGSSKSGVTRRRSDRSLAHGLLALLLLKKHRLLPHHNQKLSTNIQAPTGAFPSK